MYSVIFESLIGIELSYPEKKLTPKRVNRDIQLMAMRKGTAKV